MAGIALKRSVKPCFHDYPSKNFFLYPLKDYNMNLQPTLLCKITIPYSYTILLETIPRGAKDYDYPKAN